jgi:DNA topoisomerase-1
LKSTKHREYRKASTRAGLRYVTDGCAGVTRRLSGKGWSYYDADGTCISDTATRKRLNPLATPPAWTSVWICPDPEGHIQVTARDARGRKQYLYHHSCRETRDQSKFRRMLEFREILPVLRERVGGDLRAGELSRRQLLATVVRLLDRTMIRVGNDEYARENDFYGLATLRRKHVQVDGTTLRFSFRGKSGVEHSVAINDRRLARIVLRCQDFPGPEIFQYLDAFGKRKPILSDDVNNYLREISGRDIIAKDFRT